MLKNPIDFLDQLTPEQEAQIPLYIEKWKKIALSTERIDRQRATDAITAAYQWFDCEAPEIIFFDSPYEAFKELEDSWKEYLDFSLRFDLRHPLLNYEHGRAHDSTALYERTVLEQELLKIVLDIYNLYPVLEDWLDKHDMSIPDEHAPGCYNIQFSIPECCFYDFCISALNVACNQQQWQIYREMI